MQTQQVSNTQAVGIQSYLEAQEGRVEKILDGSKHIQSKPLINKFLFALHKNEKLKTCSRLSLLNSLLFCAEKGLAPIHGKVVLIPYGSECQAIIGVPGIRELIRRNPDVKRVGGDVVRAKDDFKIVSGLNPTIHHIPNLTEEAEVIGSYAFAELISGEYVLRYCNLEEIKASRTASKGSGSENSPWKKYFSEMARLVPLRKISKELITDEVSLSFDTTYEENIRPSQSNSFNHSMTEESAQTIDHEEFKNESYDYSMGEAA